MSALVEEEIYSQRALDAPNPVLCYQTRCGIVENVHRGVICCVSITADTKQQPKVIYSNGNINQLFFPRSAVKYIQILPLLESGAVEHYGFTLEELAVMCASHSSSPVHLNAVRSILSKIGAHESDLRCGGHTPEFEEDTFEYIRNGTTTPFKDHIYNNCSGKHAGFLALCKYKGFPLEGHLNVDHPAQVLIRAAIADMFCIPPDELRFGIDGCRYVMMNDY